ncbi:MAG: monofunctional biosynthetic peptidoglycan transglycosylase [Pseudomonadota bacterium]
MAKASSKSRKKTPPKKRRTTRAKRQGPIRTLVRRVLRWSVRGVLAVCLLVFVLVLSLAFIRPPATPYMLAERARLGSVTQIWIPIEDMVPDLPRSVVAAEDANFCLHWGFDMAAIRAAIDDGASRGASTLSQQTVKNLFLWQGRSWPRKAIEAMLTPLVEAAWPKERILELYLNVAEFDDGVFGAEAASMAYFGKSASRLTAREAALLAALLPDPKGRSARAPSSFVDRRARSIADGAATIAADGRAECFQP